MNERLPPQNREAEEAVLGSILIDPDAYHDVSRLRLAPTHFYLQVNGWVFEAIQALHNAHEPIDALTVSEQLRKQKRIEAVGGEAYIIGLINAVPTSINAVSYGRTVKQLAERREMINTALKIANDGYDESISTDDLISTSEAQILAVRGRENGRGLINVSHYAASNLERMERVQRGEEFAGIPTPWIDLNRAMKGLKKDKLILVAARPGMGKTSLKVQMGYYAACQFNKRVAHFSLEMSGEQIVQRYISGMSGIPVDRIEDAELSDGEWKLYYECHQRLSQLPIFIDDGEAVTPSYIRSECRRLYAEHGLDLVIIDYAGLMDSDGKHFNRVNQQGEISRALKNLTRAKEFGGVPVVCGLQLSRAVESRQDKRPMLSDLRDSGTWEQDADIVTFLYRDDYYNEASERPNVAELIIAKNRQGATKKVELYWNGPTTSFKNLETRDLPRF